MTPIKWMAAALPLLLVLAQFAGPSRTNPAEIPGRGIRSRLSVPPRVARILDRSCRDCHSHRTVWPWYSRVAPVSWFVIDHVNFGRRKMNLSDWAQYDPNKTRELLEQMCELAAAGEMPLPPYRWMHEKARLVPGDVETLCGWSREERDRLRKEEESSGGAAQAPAP